MRARFTALYVQTGKRERESDKRRLEAHVQFAKESGAEIVMTHGENVPVQIAEYAHLSNVTKIVIGQSSAKRNHFFSKQTLTEKLIEAVPDINIHIISTSEIKVSVLLDEVDANHAVQAIHDKFFGE